MSELVLPGVRVEGMAFPQPVLPLKIEAAQVAKSLVIGVVIVSFATKRAPHTPELETCATRLFFR